MPALKISALPENPTVTDAMEVPCSVGGTTYRVSVGEIKSHVGGGRMARVQFFNSDLDANYSLTVQHNLNASVSCHWWVRGLTLQSLAGIATLTSLNAVTFNFGAPIEEGAGAHVIYIVAHDNFFDVSV